MIMGKICRKMSKRYQSNGTFGVLNGNMSNAIAILQDELHFQKLFA